MRPFLATLVLLFAGVSSTPSFQAKLVEYDIDGSVKTANTTLRNASGSTEQRRVELPFHMSFIAPVGAFAYISAQKPSREGTVHVTLHINSQQVGTATSDVPFGIATASGRVN